MYIVEVEVAVPIPHPSRRLWCLDPRLSVPIFHDGKDGNATNIRSHRAPCSWFAKKVSLQLSLALPVAIHQSRSIEGNTQHWPQPVAGPHLYQPVDSWPLLPLCWISDVSTMEQLQEEHQADDCEYYRVFVVQSPVTQILAAFVT